MELLMFYLGSVVLNMYLIHRFNVTFDKTPWSMGEALLISVFSLCATMVIVMVSLFYICEFFYGERKWLGLELKEKYRVLNEWFKGTLS